jgi:alkanesulfonate monooxygenase SsuD/methylene tetrahydromethanopterin reductase-like flavin-dependent oxidoreductase (luciferase family)
MTRFGHSLMPGHPDKVVDAVSAYWEAGFTDVALVQVGDEGQDRFLAEAAGPLLDKLRAAAP